MSATLRLDLQFGVRFFPINLYLFALMIICGYAVVPLLIIVISVGPGYEYYVNPY